MKNYIYKIWRGGLETDPAWSHKPNDASSSLAPATLRVLGRKKYCNTCKEK